MIRRWCLVVGVEGEGGLIIAGHRAATCLGVINSILTRRLASLSTRIGLDPQDLVFRYAEHLRQHSQKFLKQGFDCLDKMSSQGNAP